MSVIRADLFQQSIDRRSEGDELPVSRCSGGA